MRVGYVTVAVAIATVAISAPLSGCSVKNSIDQRLAPEPTTVTVEATVAAVDASIDGTLTKGFPAELPMWPGAKVAKSKATKTPQGTSYSAAMTTWDPFDDVLAGVGEGLEQSEWTVEATDASTAEATVTILMISSSDADGIVTISQTPKKPVRIEYVVTPKK